jgi:hypothetical protein
MVGSIYEIKPFTKVLANHMNSNEDNEMRLAELAVRNAELYRAVGMLCTVFTGLEIELRDGILATEAKHPEQNAKALSPDAQYTSTVKHYKKLAERYLKKTRT